MRDSAGLGAAIGSAVTPQYANGLKEVARVVDQHVNRPNRSTLPRMAAWALAGSVTSSATVRRWWCGPSTEARSVRRDRLVLVSPPARTERQTLM